MVATPPTTDQLNALVGREVSYRGRRLRVVDVLTEGPSLVLTEPGRATPIQANQFGEAARRAPGAWTIPVVDPGTGELHPLLHELALIDPE